MKKLLVRIIKRKKAFICTIMIIMLSLIPNTKAYAYATFNNHILEGGVGNYGSNTRYYYIASSSSAFTTPINNAMYEWVHTTSRLGITTPISFQRTYTQSQSVIDVYTQIYTMYPYNGFYAWVDHIKNGSVVDADTTNWSWNKIFINSLNSGGLNDTDRKGVVAHEIGHCFGLAHSSNSNSIMYIDYNFGVYSAQADDCNGINYLY